MSTTTVKRDHEGTLVVVMPDGTTRPLPDTADWSEVDGLTDEQIEAAALADPDAQPSSAEALTRARQGPPPRVVRLRLKLSREVFCSRYQIPIDQLVAWETRQADPGPVVRAYMKLIMNDPEGVAGTLAMRPEHPDPAQPQGTAKPRAAE